MKIINKYRKFIFAAVITILAILMIHSNAALSKSAFPLYQNHFQTYFGIGTAMFLILFNGSLISEYLKSALAALLASSIGIYLKIYHYSVPTFKKEEDLALFQSALQSYLAFLKNYYWMIILLAVGLGLLGTYISKVSDRIDERKGIAGNSFLGKTKSLIYMSIFTSITAVSAIKMNLSFRDMDSPYIGIGIALILLFIQGFMISNYKYSILSALVVSLLGIFLKVNYYVLPYFADTAYGESYINEQFLPHIATLKSYFWAYSLSLLAAALLGTLLAKAIQSLGQKMKEQEENKVFLDSRMISYISVFVAISVVVNVLRVGVLSFGGFPIIFSGFVLGPLAGFIVGGLADVISFIIRPSGDFNILFTLTSALTGAIPILVVRFLGKEDAKLPLWKAFVGIAVGQLITSVLLAPLFLALFMGTDKGFMFYAVKAFVKQAFSVPIYAIVLVSLHESLMRSGVKLENVN